jgi:hypothetical protein
VIDMAARGPAELSESHVRVPDFLDNGSVSVIQEIYRNSGFSDENPDGTREGLELARASGRERNDHDLSVTRPPASSSLTCRQRRAVSD